jgi:hypothetical protein
MKQFKCVLSFEEIVEAEDREEARIRFLECIEGLSGGWEEDNTEITEIEDLKGGER